MSSRNPQPRRLVRPLQWLALTLPLLVIGLGLVAVRPDWHALLHVQNADAGHAHHGHSHDEADNELGCAIELFASGLVEIVSGGSALNQPPGAFSIALAFPSDLLRISSARLEPPGRAPPIAP